MVWILKFFIFIYKFILNSDVDVKLMLTAQLAINQVQSQMRVKLPHYKFREWEWSKQYEFSWWEFWAFYLLRLAELWWMAVCSEQSAAGFEERLCRDRHGRVWVGYTVYPDLIQLIYL